MADSDDDSKCTAHVTASQYTLLRLRGKYYISITPATGGLCVVRNACAVGSTAVSCVENPLTCVLTKSGLDPTAPLVHGGRPLFYCRDDTDWHGPYRVFQANSAPALSASLGRFDPEDIPTVGFVENVADLITDEMAQAAKLFKASKKAMDDARAWFEEEALVVR